MIIDIQNTKTYYINLDDKVDRKVKTENHLKSLNFTNVERYSAKRGQNAIEGCALSHIDILRTNAKNIPFLIVEDDVAPNYAYRNQIEVPNNVDGIYLGYSMWGYDLNRAKKFSRMNDPTKFEPISSNVYKIENMLSTHAILYCTEQYALAAADIMETILNGEGWHCDYAVGLIQKNFNVYAPIKPYFVQSDHWTYPWTSVGLDDFDIQNKLFKEKINDPIRNP
jgi:hypothetical protein